MNFVLKFINDFQLLKTFYLNKLSLVSDSKIFGFHVDKIKLNLCMSMIILT